MTGTPLSFTSELQAAIQERKILTTRSRMKVLSALHDLDRASREQKHKEQYQKVVQEILTSEASYLHQLEVVMKFFMEPLRSMQCLSNIIFNSLFGNIEMLYKVNKELLEEINKNPENVEVGFQKIAPYMKLYSVYAYDYRQALEILVNMRTKHKEVFEFVASQETRPEVGTSLQSLLIVPIQRVPRYRLLLQELLAHTQMNTAKYRLIKGALEKIEETATHINELVSDYEEAEVLVALARRFNQDKLDIVIPGRRVLKQGPLMKVSRSGSSSQRRYLVLFTDSLLLCKGHTDGPLTFSLMLPLKHSRVEPVIGTGLFKVECKGETLLLYTACAEEGQDWIRTLQAAMKQHMDCRQTLRKESSKRKPLRRKDLQRAQDPTDTGEPPGCLGRLKLRAKRARTIKKT